MVQEQKTDKIYKRQLAIKAKNLVSVVLISSIGFMSTINILIMIAILYFLAQPIAQKCMLYGPYLSCAAADSQLIILVIMQVLSGLLLLVLIIALIRIRSRANMLPIMLAFVAMVFNLPSLFLAFVASRDQIGEGHEQLFVLTVPFNLIALLFSILSRNRIKRNTENYTFARNLLMASFITNLPLAFLTYQVLSLSSWGENVA